MRELERVGLKYNPFKKEKQNILHLNTQIRATHPLHEFLRSLPQDNLLQLYKYYHIDPKKAHIVNLGNKIFSVAPQYPIGAAVKALSFTGTSPPKKIIAAATFTGPQFEGLPLQNPNTTCYINAAINSLAGCDVVRQILTISQITNDPNFYNNFISWTSSNKTFSDILKVLRKINFNIIARNIRQGKKYFSDG